MAGLAGRAANDFYWKPPSDSAKQQMSKLFSGAKGIGERAKAAAGAMSAGGGEDDPGAAECLDEDLAALDSYWESAAGAGGESAAAVDVVAKSGAPAAESPAAVESPVEEIVEVAAVEEAPPSPKATPAVLELEDLEDA